MTPCEILLKPLTGSISRQSAPGKKQVTPQHLHLCVLQRVFSCLWRPEVALSHGMPRSAPQKSHSVPHSILSRGPEQGCAVPGGSRCEGTWFPRCPFHRLVLPLSPPARWLLAAASCHIPSSGIAPCILCLLLLSNGSLTPLSLIVFDYPRQSLSLPRRVPRGIPPLPCINQHKHPCLSAGWIQPL